MARMSTDAVPTSPSLASTISSSRDAARHTSTTEPEGVETTAEAEAEGEDHFDPLRCLFCTSSSSSTSPSLADNLQHMARAHGFFIPHAAALIDLASFLGYLATVVRVFRQCLLCRGERATAAGVREHMRARGHCRFDLANEELRFVEFYDFGGGEEEEEEGDVDGEDDGEEEEEVLLLIPDEDGLRLPSGKTLGHRSQAHHRHRVHKTPSSTASISQDQQHLPHPHPHLPPTTTEQDPNPPPPPPPPAIHAHAHALANPTPTPLRAGTATSLAGVPPQQQRALIVAEKRMEAVEARARGEYRARVERGANRQKRFRVRSMGKKQAGLEKRLG